MAAVLRDNALMAEKSKKSDLSRAFSEDGALKTHVGGQALLEGIMMRGKYNWAVAVREPEGSVYTEEHDLASGKDKNGWLYWPFIRGCRAFVESLALGYKALSISAEHAFVEEEDEASRLSATEETAPLSDGGARVEPGIKSEGDPVFDHDATRASDSLCASSSPDTSNGIAEPTVDLAEEGSEAPSDTFSWKRDFGNPDEMIDGLLAQRELNVIDGDTGKPVQIDVDRAPLSTEEGDSSLATPKTADAYEPRFDEVSAPAHDEDTTRDSDPQQPSEKKPLLGTAEMTISMILGLVLGVALFIIVPAFLTNLIVGEYDERTLLWNVVDGILRIGVFIFYIWLIGRMSDIKRMFGYHGAEHKTIHCFEHGLPLTPENARSFPRLHVRCGTAFLIMVMIIAIFVYTITPLDALITAWGVPSGPPKLVLVIVVRILLMPLIAGIAYEITVKWAGSHPDNPLVKVILWPGMQMQRLTTREPDDGQIECAIAAMQLVLEREQRQETNGIAAEALAES